MSGAAPTGGTRRDRQLRLEIAVALAAVVAVCSLLSWLFLRADPGDRASRLAYEQALHGVQRTDAELNAAVLSNRLGLESNFDAMTSHVARLKTLGARLSRLPDASMPDELRQALDDSRREYLALQARKARYVDDFKRSHSVLRNSMAYFPVTVERLGSQPLQPSELRLIEAYGLAVLNHSQNPDPAIAARAESLAAQLGRLHESLPPELETLVRHGRAIIGRKPEVDAISREILDLPTAAVSERLLHDYSRSLGYANQQAHRLRLLLYLAALCLAAYLAAVLLRLGKTSGALRQANSDLQDRIRIEKRTAAELRLYASVFTNAREGMIVTDGQTRIVAVNPAFTAITGYPADEVLGRTPSMLASGRHDRGHYQEMWAQLKIGGQWAGEIWNRRKDGSVYPEWLSITAVGGDPAAPAHYIGLFSDITERKEAEARIEHLAHHDLLTGLPNRALMSDRLDHAISHCRRQDTMLAVLFVDLDRFKVINDTLGHDVGDALLVEAAERCREIVRESDTVSRQGDDEFVILLSQLRSAQDARHVTHKLIDLLSRPYALGDHELTVTASIGIAVYPGDGDTASELMRNADGAMNRAKAEGRNRFEFHSPDLKQDALGQLLMENQLRGALERDELLLYYQPKICARSGRCTGLEALLRWQHPVEGLLLPGRFIRSAENCGLIVPIGAWVVDKVCRQLRAWLDAGLAPPRVAVNLSAHQFARQDVENLVAAALEAHGIPAELLELEITETMLMRSPDEAAALLRRLRARGLTVSIDDFGTGYSSLGYLRTFPVHELKIDAGFVRGIEPSGDDGKIAKAIIALAHELGLSVVAEGVETPYQHEFLVEHGCDQLQGFLFDRPLPPGDAIKHFRAPDAETPAVPADSGPD